MSRKKKSKAPAGQRASNSSATAARWGERFILLLLLVPPLLVSVQAREAFRLPKLMASEWLALVSLVCFAWALTGVEQLDLRAIGQKLSVRAVAPMLLIATLGAAFTVAPHFTYDGLFDFWVGAVCLVGWSLALPGDSLRRLLDWMMVPAVILALLGILQFHGGTPLAFLGEMTERLGVTSLAGNPGDLGAYLVLPVLLGQAALVRGKRRWLWAIALLITVYGLAVTQTLTALIGLAVGSLVLWWFLLPRRRAILLLGGGAVLAAVAVLALAPLRTRVVDKLDDLRKGELNRVLTGRLDGWWAAGWMVRQHPLVGVGHGAYRAEFSQAKLALTDQGVEFLRTHNQPFFANAHNEYLEVAAEWGIPGALALLWALWLLWGALRRIDAPDPAEGPSPRSPDRALAFAGTAALAMVALTNFPFRIALTAFPALLFLAWVLRRGEEGA